MVQRQDRAQTTLELLAVDPATGRSEVVLTERAGEGHWINLSDDYRFLADGGFVWWSERDGYGHLYRYADANADPVQLTRGRHVVSKLVGVDEDAGTVFYTANAGGPLEQHVYSVPLAGGEPTRLTEPGYTHSATMDEGGRTLLIARSSHEQPPQSYLADAEGNRLAWVEENALDAQHPYAPHLPSHRPARFGTLTAADGATELHWKMVTPPLEPGRRYPVFFYHYGGPGPQIVTRGWDGGAAAGGRRSRLHLVRARQSRLAPTVALASRRRFITP